MTLLLRCTKDGLQTLVEACVFLVRRSPPISRAKTVGRPVRSVPMSEADTLRPSNSSYFVRRATANLRSPRYRHGVSRVVDHFANESRVAYSLVTLVSRNSNFLSSFKGSFKAGVHIGRVRRQLVYDCYDSPQKSRNESRRVTRPGNPER